MVHSKVYEDNKDLMVTYTDDLTKYLHKVGTEEYYEDPIDLISGVYEYGERKGEPKCRFEYEEADKPVEEVVEEEIVENDEPDGTAEDNDTQEA